MLILDNLILDADTITKIDNQLIMTLIIGKSGDYRLIISAALVSVLSYSYACKKQPQTQYRQQFDDNLNGNIIIIVL